MIIPGILAMRPRDTGVNWLLRSASVLAVSKNRRIDTEAFLHAMSVQFVRKGGPEFHMATGQAKAASVMFVREKVRHMAMPLMREASFLVASKRFRDPPTIKVRSGAMLVATKRPKSAPNVRVRLASLLIVSKEAA